MLKVMLWYSLWKKVYLYWTTPQCTCNIKTSFWWLMSQGVSCHHLIGDSFSKRWCGKLSIGIEVPNHTPLHSSFMLTFNQHDIFRPLSNLVWPLRIVYVTLNTHEQCRTFVWISVPDNGKICSIESRILGGMFRTYLSISSKWGTKV